MTSWGSDLSPSRVVNLPIWTSTQVDGWEGLVREGKELERQAGLGKNSDDIYRRAVKILKKANGDQFSELVSQRRGARAVLMVWNDDEALARTSMSEQFLREVVDGVAGARTSFLQGLLLDLHFRYFDQLEECSEGLFDCSAVLIRESSAAELGARTAFATQVLSHAGDLLALDAPVTLANAVATSGMSLARYLRTNGLGNLDVGRFGTLVRNELFLRRIQLADPLGNDPVLEEVVREEVLAYPEGNGRLFGHRVLEALALTPAAHQAPSDGWIATIDTIAGDPRLRHTDLWRRWWQPVSEEARSAVIAWLSAIDLKLFLHAVQEFGTEESVDALERLFPGRKRFLEGLLDTGLVKETRLFFGDDVMSSVSRQLGTSLKFKPDRYKSKADTAIIYLDCGSFHVVEGSHNFRMWIYLFDVPELLRDRRRREVTHETLTRVIPRQHRDLVKLVGDFQAYDSVRHQGLWQAPAIRFLHRNGVALDVQRLLTPYDYSMLKTRHGIPPVRSLAKRLGDG